jgi:hypothetical protein
MKGGLYRGKQTRRQYILQDAATPLIKRGLR